VGIHLPGAGVLHTRYGFAIATSLKIKAAKKLLIAPPSGRDAMLRKKNQCS